MSIYIVSHLRLYRPRSQGYRVMYVGPQSTSFSSDDFADNDSSLTPNISFKNKTYCELTALHQITQLHAHSPDTVVGLVHYRRRFINGSKWLRQIIRSTQKAKWCRGISNFLLHRYELTKDQASHLLASYDVILPTFTQLKKSVCESYSDAHIAEDWHKVKQIIHTDFTEYANAFDQFESQNSIHLYNMFVARAGFLQSYADWLFPVMEQLEQVIDTRERDDFQSRVFGFLSERLFNVYLLKHSELKVLQMPVVQLYNQSVVRM